MYVQKPFLIMGNLELRIEMRIYELKSNANFR